MNANELVGTTMLLYGLVNPIGVVPIYLSLVQRVSAERAHRIILVAAAAVACLLATGINVATRLMALIVASVGIDFILTGIEHRWY